MAKKWLVKRSELAKDQFFGKLHSPSKFAELAALFDGAADLARLPHKEKINGACRKLLEEVANIAQHNTSWNEVKVNIDINSSKTRYKIRIEYDGGQYFDPSALRHVVDSARIFEEYEREFNVEDDGTVIIKVNIALIKEE